MARRPAAALPLSSAERSALQEFGESVSRPYWAVREAKGLLMAAEGVANTRIAAALGVSRSTVIEWREHFRRDGVNWVGKVHEGRGRKPVIDKAVITMMVEDTRTTTPPAATHWSTRTMAAHSGLSRTTVQREWRARGLKPHLVKTFKISNDPRFEEKLIDVVGLYLNPPDNAVVLSFEEKSQIQALDRTQPSLPMTPGRAGTTTHDFTRNGTTTLFAALNIATGQLIGGCFSCHRHEQVLAFLQLIDAEVEKGKQNPHRPGQLRDSHARRRRALARKAQALPSPLHPDKLVVVEPCGALVPRDHHQPDSTGQLRECRCADRGDRGVRPAQQRAPETLQLDQDRWGDQRQGASRQSGARSGSPIARYIEDHNTSLLVRIAALSSMFLFHGRHSHHLKFREPMPE